MDEEPAWRNRERAEGVRPHLGQQPQIGVEEVLRGKREAVVGRPERPVRDAADVDLVIPDEEELAADGDRSAVERGSGSPLRKRAQHGLAHTGRREAGK